MREFKALFLIYAKTRATIITELRPKIPVKVTPEDCEASILNITEHFPPIVEPDQITVLGVVVIINSELENELPEKVPSNVIDSQLHVLPLALFGTATIRSFPTMMENPFFVHTSSQVLSYREFPESYEIESPVDGKKVELPHVPPVLLPSVQQTYS